MTIANVKLWGRTIGAVSWDEDRGYAFFEFDPQFVKSGIQIAPLTMPLSRKIFSFPGLARETFYGLPGMLADSLPDKFGNALINAWLVKEGRAEDSMDSVAKLCYISSRGMGALEYSPARGPRGRTSKSLDIDALVALASEILTKRGNFKVSLHEKHKAEALRDILRVGTSAGGARAKALIAWNPNTNEVKSGQIRAGENFSYWLLKFDGVSGNQDKELDDPRGYGLIEYSYYKMALIAGIAMPECRLLEESGRHHFMAKRFDRTDSGDKLHMQSLCAMAHYDFNQAGVYSYEQAIQVMKLLDLSMTSIEEQYRRMAFNIVGRNQDDHVKNIAYVMDKGGTWSLSPGFDLTYAFNPGKPWTRQHQMSMNGKRDNFAIEDFDNCAKNAGLKRGRHKEILEQVQIAVSEWPRIAREVGVPADKITKIEKTHRFLEL
jgi:serine/threonine-protein kinase HipA